MLPTAHLLLLTAPVLAKKYKPTSFRLIRNIDQYEIAIWPVNIGNFHWALIYHSLQSPLFYLASWGDAETRRSRMSPAILDAINEFFKRYNNTFAWASASFMKVPQQHMNDCGPVANEVMRRLMMNESVDDFELNKAIGVRLRIT